VKIVAIVSAALWLLVGALWLTLGIMSLSMPEPDDDLALRRRLSSVERMRGLCGFATGLAALAQMAVSLMIAGI
jgi:hypothetical protein